MISSINKMRTWMIRRNYARTTIKSYVQHAQYFLIFCSVKVFHLEERHISRYLDHLRIDRGLSQATLNIAYSGLKIFWEKALRKPWPTLSIPRSRRIKRLPQVLSRKTVRRLIEHTKNLKHRTILRTMYATGIRLGEVVNLKFSDIDADRGAILVRQGKGNKDRHTILPLTLLCALRDYYRAYVSVRATTGGRYTDFSPSARAAARPAD